METGKVKWKLNKKKKTKKGGEKAGGKNRRGEE